MSSRASPSFVCLLAVLALLMIHCEPVDSRDCGRPDLVHRNGCLIPCVLDLGARLSCRHNKPRCLCRDPMCYPYDPEDSETSAMNASCLMQTPIKCETDEYGNRICKPYNFYDLVHPAYKKFHQQPSAIGTDYPDDYEYV